MRTPTKVAVIVYALETPHNPKYLLLKTNVVRGQFWQPVTGGVEAGETIIEAAIREVQEETRLDIIGDPVRMDYVYRFPIAPDKKNRYPQQCHEIEEHAFMCRVPYAQPILDPSEHESFEWKDFNEACTILKWETNQSALKMAHHALTQGRHKTFCK